MNFSIESINQLNRLNQTCIEINNKIYCEDFITYDFPSNTIVLFVCFLQFLGN